MGVNCNTEQRSDKRYTGYGVIDLKVVIVAQQLLVPNKILFCHVYM